jgi:formyltetrahydrofolate-dependent phosphoribosylglycinamide formyltransferase
MFERLQKKWKVSGLQLALILCTFAIGGSLTGYAARRLMNIFSMEKGWTWIVLYIIIVTLLWPVAVIIVSVFFGQFRFFTDYLRKIGKRMGLIASSIATGGAVTNVAIFASGAGSNAQKIIDRFRTSDKIRIALIVCNKPGAGVLQIANTENIPVLMIAREQFFEGDGYLPELREKQIAFIVLAGFLWKLPSTLINAYPRRIVNIHPALLPGFGGKGMHGNNVHAAVIAAGEKESGITIHYVDEHYDNGDIIFQARCLVQKGDTPDTLAQRVHALEHKHYPAVIEQILDTNP